jgi:hypothetical protein
MFLNVRSVAKRKTKAEFAITPNELLLRDYEKKSNGLLSVPGEEIKSLLIVGYAFVYKGSEMRRGRNCVPCLCACDGCNIAIKAVQRDGGICVIAQDGTSSRRANGSQRGG